MVLAACGGAQPLALTATNAMTPAPPVTPVRSVPEFSHIFVIVMENKEAGQISGSDDAPYFNALASTYASAAEYHGITHPSLPNYIAMTSGDTFVTTNCTDCTVAEDNLASQIDVSGRTWKAYMESMPGPCFLGDAPPLYMQKHNPFIYFNSVRNNPEMCNRVVPLTQLSADIEADAVPEFVWITPDMCSDTHDCPIRTGDDWLKLWVPKILATEAWQEDGVLFITYDEGTSLEGCCTYAAGGRIATLVISPLGKPGYVSNVPYDHYSLLRTIETAWGLPLLGKAACDCSAVMDDFFVSR
jgi:phospholipase C